LDKNGSRFDSGYPSVKHSPCLPTVAAVLVVFVLSTQALANSAASVFSKRSAAGFASNTQINLFNIYDMGNSGGTITFNAATQTLTLTSNITSIFSSNGAFTGDFGTITFTTGPLISGSIYTYATFNSGTFTINTNGTDGLPNGVLLSGTFELVHWQEIGHTNEYSFSAYFTGSSSYIQNNGGIMTQESVLVSGTTQTQFNVIQGHTVVPEPGTWALLGTGLCFVVGVGCRTGIGWSRSVLGYRANRASRV
jgi:hypothetical protein